MTVSEALHSLVSYPIPALRVEAICIARNLDKDSELNKSVIDSSLYKLATADVYSYMITAPDLKEQDVSISLADRKYYKQQANIIYSEQGENKGGNYGFKGENWNA